MKLYIIGKSIAKVTKPFDMVCQHFLCLLTTQLKEESLKSLNISSFLGLLVEKVVSLRMSHDKLDNRIEEYSFLAGR